MASEIQENIDASINLNMLKDLENSILEVGYHFVDYKKYPEDVIKQYVQISKCFSKYFPKVSDESLFEIDDLCYENEELYADINHSVPLEAPRVRKNKCITSYISISLRMIYYSNMPPSRILDNAFLQVIQCSKNKHYIGSRMFMCAVGNLLNSRNTYRICFGLKMLKVIIGNQHVNLFDSMYPCDEDAIYWMKTYLPNIPHSGDPNQKRITSWISQQSSLINKALQLNHPSLFRDRMKYYLERFDTYREFDVRFVNRMRRHINYLQNVICDHLYLFFTSAKNDEEKTKRLKNFLEGGASTNLDVLDESGRGVEIDEVQETDWAMKCWGDLLIVFNSTFENIFNGITYSDDVLRKMEDRFGFEVKPYLDGDSNQVDEYSKSHFKCERICSSLKTKDENEDHEYFIEKYLFYDEFVKMLNVLNIIHTACMMCQELLQTSGDFEDYDSSVFRKIHHIPITFIREAFLNPSKRGYIPWLIEILIKKCPFMILPKRYDFLMEDLIKLLKGEQMDELVEEKIYLAMFTKKRRFKND